MAEEKLFLLLLEAQWFGAGIKFSSKGVLICCDGGYWPLVVHLSATVFVLEVQLVGGFFFYACESYMQGYMTVLSCLGWIIDLEIGHCMYLYLVFGGSATILFL